MTARTITTYAELDALPVGSVVRGAEYEYGPTATIYVRQEEFWYPGWGADEEAYFDLPVVVLHDPSAPAPVWDEDTVTEAVARRLHADACSEYDYAWEPNAGTFRDQARELLAVVREHLPVRPDREAVALTLCKEQDSIEHMEQTDDAPCSRCLAWTDAVLDLWPGESRAQVEAEALRAAADAMDADPEVRDPLRLRSDWLRARADRLDPKEVDRG